MPEVRKTRQFDRWLAGLRDTQARARILKRIVRLGNGNPGVVEPVGDHVSEIKIDVGPGYRLYFVEPVKGQVVVLLCGGDKDSQDRDIATAKAIAKILALKSSPMSSSPDRLEMCTMSESRTIETSPFDAADYLATPEDAAAYLSAVLEDGDASEFKAALGAIARSRSMRIVAETAGLGRESLYKALAPDGNPTFDTVLRVMAALDLRLSATLAPPRQPEAA